MRVPRVSLGKAMVMVMAIAVNCGLIRRLVLGANAEDLPAIYQASGALLMANILVLGLYRVVSLPEERRPFLVGFEVAGLVAILSFFASSEILFTKTFVNSFLDSAIVGPILEFCEEWLLPVAFLAVVFGLPQLLLALAGGLLTWLVAGRSGNPPAGDRNPASDTSDPTNLAPARCEVPMKFRFSIFGLMAVVVLAAIGLAALRSPTELWASAIFTVMVGLLGYALLGTMFGRAPKRKSWAGFAVFGWVYLILVFDIFSAKVQVKPPPLLPVGLLASMDSRLNPQVVMTWQDGGGSLSYINYSGPMPVLGSNSVALYHIAHSLVTLVVALVGSVMAGIVAAREEG